MNATTLPLVTFPKMKPLPIAPILFAIHATLAPLGVGETPPAPSKFQPPSPDGLAPANPSYEVRTWYLPPWSFEVPGEKKGERVRLQSMEYLTAKGIAFTPGAFAAYSRSTGTFTVRNTKTQLDAVDRLFKQRGKVIADPSKPTDKK